MGKRQSDVTVMFERDGIEGDDWIPTYRANVIERGWRWTGHWRSSRRAAKEEARREALPIVMAIRRLRKGKS